MMSHCFLYSQTHQPQACCQRPTMHLSSEQLLSQLLLHMNKCKTFSWAQMMQHRLQIHECLEKPDSGSWGSQGRLSVEEQGWETGPGKGVWGHSRKSRVQTAESSLIRGMESVRWAEEEEASKLLSDHWVQVRPESTSAFFLSVCCLCPCPLLYWLASLLGQAVNCLISACAPEPCT